MESTPLSHEMRVCLKSGLGLYGVTSQSWLETAQAAERQRD